MLNTYFFVCRRQSQINSGEHCINIVAHSKLDLDWFDENEWYEWMNGMEYVFT